MNSEDIFRYSYSARESQEVQAIRDKYLPRRESKLDELKQLDGLVQAAGIPQSLCVGTAGCLIFGLGLCLAMGVIGHSLWLGIVLGVVGITGILFAYPVYRKFFDRTKSRYAPRILELAAELTGEI